MFKAFMAIGLMTGMAFSQITFKIPVTKAHVKMVNNLPVKYTSKLKKLVMLNFTMGNGHQTGKISWRTIMQRLPTEYAVAGVPAYTIQNFETSADGSGAGVPNFTATDLNSADVIFANNVSMFGDAQMDATKQTAIQTAIETNGKGYLGVHGSGDNQRTAWPWYTNTLHPMNYAGHGARTQGPVYKHLAEKDHMVLDGIFATKTTVRATVPDEINAGGTELFANNIPVRSMLNEWYEFGRDISRDPAFAAKVTILMKYDGRVPVADGSLPQQYYRKGGNLFTYLYKVGNGMTSYAPPGHDYDETTNPTGTFDQGTGDIDRYTMQLLYFLAGYTVSPCDASCNGMPLVDPTNHYTGETYNSVGILNSEKPAFYLNANKKYEATLSDVSGTVVDRKTGMGSVGHEFDTSKLKAGVYFLSLRVGGRPAQTKRYVVVPSAR